MRKLVTSIVAGVVVTLGLTAGAPMAEAAPKRPPCCVHLDRVDAGHGRICTRLVGMGRSYGFVVYPCPTGTVDGSGPR